MITIVFAPPDRLLNLNDRQHYMQRSGSVKLWRQAGWAYGNNARRKHGTQGPSVVQVTLPISSGLKRARDPHNYTPTMKAIIDGLVDAKLWPDDNSDWVTTLEPVLDEGSRNVLVLIWPREPVAQGA